MNYQGIRESEVIRSIRHNFQNFSSQTQKIHGSLENMQFLKLNVTCTVSSDRKRFAILSHSLMVKN